MLPTTISSGFPLPHNSVAAAAAAASFGHVTSAPSGGNGNGSSYNGGTTTTPSSNPATTNGGGNSGPGGTGGSGGGGGGGGGAGAHQFSFASPTAAPSGKEGWYLIYRVAAGDPFVLLTVALSPPLCSQFRIQLVDVQRGLQFIATE